MAEREYTTASIERISNLRDQTFGEAYEKHDVGTAAVRDRLAEFRLQVVNHGDDRRDDEDIYSGTGVDLGIEKDGVSCGYTEVKCKSSHEWLGRLNRHDWHEYRGFAATVDVPVFVSFFHVTDVDAARIDETWHVRVPPSDEADIAEELPFTSKGHKLVEIDDDHAVGWPTVVAACYEHV